MTSKRVLYLHKKYGEIYHLLHYGKDADSAEVAIYQGKNGQIWVSPKDEFHEQFIELNEVCQWEWQPIETLPEYLNVAHLWVQISSPKKAYVEYERFPNCYKFNGIWLCQNRDPVNVEIEDSDEIRYSRKATHWMVVPLSSKP